MSLIEKNQTITTPIPHGWSGGSPLSWIWTRDYSTTRATRVLPCGRQNIHPSQRGDREPEKENRRILIPKLEWEREIRRLGHGFRWGPLGVGPSDVAAGDRPARGWAWSEPAEIDSNRLRRTREPLLGTPRGLTQRGIGDGHLVFAVPGSAIIHVPFTVVYGALLTTCCTTRALRRLGKMLGSGPLFFCVPIPSAGNLLPYSAPLVSHPLPPPPPAHTRGCKLLTRCSPQGTALWPLGSPCPPTHRA